MFVSVAFDSMYMLEFIFRFYFPFCLFILLLVVIGFIYIEGHTVLW